MPPTLADDGFDSNKSMTVFLKAVGIHTGIMCIPYSGADVRRWIEVNEEDESIEVNELSEDPLAPLLVDSVIELEQTGIVVGNNEVDISPAASVATIFRKTKDARDLKGRMWIAYNLRDANASVCGVLTSCKWELSDVFLNSRFTPQRLERTDELPNDLGSYWFVDTISSVTRPAGAMLLLQCYAYAARTHKRGVCMVAVTTGGRNLATGMGFSSHQYRDDGATRWLCWAPIGSLRLRTVTSRLNIGGATNRVLTNVCARFGLTSATSDRIMMRC